MIAPPVLLYPSSSFQLATTGAKYNTHPKPEPPVLSQRNLGSRPSGHSLMRLSAIVFTRGTKTRSRRYLAVHHEEKGNEKRAHLGRLVKHDSHAFLLALPALACVDRLRTCDPGFFSPQLYVLSFGGRIGKEQLLRLTHFHLLFLLLSTALVPLFQWKGLEGVTPTFWGKSPTTSYFLHSSTFSLSAGGSGRGNACVRGSFACNKSPELVPRQRSYGGGHLLSTRDFGATFVPSYSSGAPEEIFLTPEEMGLRAFVHATGLRGGSSCAAV